MRIDIWSDLVCPWCYVGKRNVETALDQLGLEADIHWRAFELDPKAGPGGSKSLAEVLSMKFGVSLEEAQTMNEQMTALAKKVGLDYKLSIAQASNSFDAHRLAKFAESQGLGGQAAERLFSAYFCEGVLLSDHQALLRLGGEIGLDEGLLQSVLLSEQFSEEVRADEEQAREAGFSGVPTIVIDERFAIPGAQPPETLMRFFSKIARGDLSE